MIAQFLYYTTIFTLAKCEEESSKEVAAKPRFYIEGDSYTINLIPFFIALKIAFVLGLLLKDVLAKEMEDYVSGSYYTDGVSYTAPSSYYTYGGDPTRIAQMATNEIDDDFGNLDYFSESSPDSVRVKPKHYIIDDEKKSDFETAAAALDVTLSNVGELGISFLGTLVGLFTSAYDTPSILGHENIPKLDFVDHNPTEDTLQKGNFLRSITATPTPYYATTHTPSPYFSTPAAQQYQDNHHAYSVHPVSTPAPQQFYLESTTAKPSLLFDPNSSTLYVDTHLANTLQLDDGTSVELPTDMLLDSINSGQVQLISNSRMDNSEDMDQDISDSSQNVAIKAQVIDNQQLRHHRGNQHTQKFRPNEEWEPAPKEKVWYQINRPSFKRRKRRWIRTSIYTKSVLLLHYYLANK